MATYTSRLSFENHTFQYFTCFNNDKVGSFVIKRTDQLQDHSKLLGQRVLLPDV